MTEPRYQLPQLDLFTPCAVHACDFPVVEAEKVCAGCLDEFGDMLRPAAPCTPTQPEPAHSTGIPERNTPPRIAHPAEPHRKANQRCWLCEERRTCTKVHGQWECGDCMRV